MVRVKELDGREAGLYQLWVSWVEVGEGWEKEQTFLWGISGAGNQGQKRPQGVFELSLRFVTTRDMEIEEVTFYS